MILITGSTGQLGSMTIEELLNYLPPTEIAAMARTKGDKTKRWEEKGIDVRVGSYGDYESLLKAFKDIETLFFISTGEAFQDFTLHGNVINAAVEAGIERIIYTSTQRKTSIPQDESSLETDMHGWTETKIKESGIDYVILRNAPYMESIPLILGNEIFEKGFHSPVGDGKISFASRKDMAKGAAQILIMKELKNKTLEFGGIESISIKGIIDILSNLSGKEIPYSSPDKETYIKEGTAAGDPQELIMGQVGFADQVRTGYFDNPSDDLVNILNKETLDIKTFLKETYKL